LTYSKDELRLRIINPKLINPDTIMPAYYVKVKNPRTPKKYFNRTILIAQEVEDLVEYLHSLK
jgi:sulfur-oxidizing protein SoxX